MEKTSLNEGVRWVLFFMCILAVFPVMALGDDDPNVFNQTMGLSAVTSGTSDTGGSCGWKEVLSRDGSDGGQLTIKLNTCKVFQYTVESYPQNGGAGGTADLEPSDVVLVWDEDDGHGEIENEKNFSFTGTYDKLEVSEYEDYLDLSTTDSRTNWAVYLILTEGTFTKGSAGTNEHEVLHLSRNIMEFWKEDNIDDANCISLGDPIEYSICWSNDYGDMVSGASIIDWLPDGVDYDYIISLDPLVLDENYNIEEHYYRWELDDIDPNEWGCVHLEVTVNEDAIPGYYLYNLAEMYINGDVVAADDEYTNVCCWSSDPNIIYVDKSAIHGANTGMNWNDAYLDLADALDRARNSLCGGPFTIYVAAGTYAPQDNENGFVLPSGCSVFGGFPRGGADYSNPKKYETILTGLIDEDEFPDATKIVTMGETTLLDGVTVTKANRFGYGVYGNEVNFTLSHCVVKENLGFGIYAFNCNTEIRRTTVSNNGMDGLYHEGEGNDLKVDTSWLLRNGAYGIYCNGSTPTIRNSIVSESSMVEQGRQGLHIKNPKHQPKLYNLTVANNRAAGLHFEDDGDADGDPNNLDYPDLQNSILFFNGSDTQITGFNPDVYANFCCIEDCNTLGTTNFPDSPGFAYQVLDPNGVPESGIPDPNNYHLAANSDCIDRGNPDPSMGYELQVDYDGELRLFGDGVDVGADEVYNCYDEYVSEADVHNDLDWDADGIVNLKEFNAFSRAWLSRSPDEYGDPNFIDPNEIANWNPNCNLTDTGSSQYVIDLADLEIFLEDWLWVACWKLQEINTMTTMMSGGGEMMLMSETVMSFQTVIPAQAEIQVIQPEATVEEQIFQLQDAIAFLEQIWLEEPDLQQEISTEDWQAFLDTIHQNLVDLQTETAQIK
jgi:hypothetical protein